MSEQSAALAAIKDFVNALSDTNKSSKDLLQKQSDPFSQTAALVGGQMGDLALASDPLFSGVTDPTQLKLLKDNFSGLGKGLISDTIVEDTGNSLNKIFQQAKAATFSLFQMSPNFFFSQLSQSSARFKKLLTQAMLDAASIAAEAAAYEAFMLSMDRSDLDHITPASMAALQANAVTAMVQVSGALTQSRSQGAITPDKLNSCVTALASLCVNFTNPSAIIAVLFMNDLLSRLSILDKEVQVIMTQQAQLAGAIANTLTANVAGHIERAVSAISGQLTSDLAKLGAQISRPFDKFASLLQAVAMCQKAHILIQGFLRNPATVLGEIVAHALFPTFKTITQDLGNLGVGPAKDYLTSSTAYQQTIQSVLIAPILPQLQAKTADLLAKLGALEGWLTAQQALAAAMPIVTDALSSLADTVLGGSALDKVSGSVRAADMRAFAKATANTASTAGAAADSLGPVIQDLPLSQANKVGALANIRSSLLAIEASQVIATQAALEENPSSIGAVDTLTLQVQQIQEQSEALLSA